MTILLGLLGFSIVVVIHEFGHFLAARAVGVTVETFSIGWGPKLFAFTRRGTEWRISALPIGGFCRMKGEQGFRKALDEGLATIPAEAGSLYAASPLKRIAILISGPLANVFLAVLFFSVVALVGTTIHTAPNRIVLVSESGLASPALSPYPADLAGLKSGDYILSVDGRRVRDYADLQEFIGLNPGKKLQLQVRRGGQELGIAVTPRLDKSSGQGLIGIYSWIEPLVSEVERGSAADLAGLRPGDIVVSAGGTPILRSIDLAAALKNRPERLVLGLKRGGADLNLDLVLSWDGSGKSNLGIAFTSVTRVDKAAGPLQAIGSGLSESWSTLRLTVKSMGLLFSGVEVLKALSGPARITYYIGNTASESLKSQGISGLSTILGFLAFLSIGLFFMNLLPIPALDGGQVLLCLAELARGRPLSTKTVYRYQFVGAAMIAAIFIVATLGDVLFFAGK